MTTATPTNPDEPMLAHHRADRARNNNGGTV